MKTLSLLIASGTLLLLAPLGCADDETSNDTTADGGAASGGAGGEGGMATGGGGSENAEYVVLIQGDLFTADMDEAKDAHDPLAAGGEEAAKSLGDFGHDAMLGTTLLGTTENTFMGLDRWDNLDGLQTFYGDPQFEQAFGMLFSAPPTVETFVHQSTWHNWGDLTSGDTADQHFFVVVRGRLAESDPMAAQAAHDAVAAGGQADAEAAGDQAHVVFTGLEDAQEFLAIDIWHDSTNMEALYTNPDFVAAFGSLFSAPPVINVYGSTDWHQW